VKRVVEESALRQKEKQFLPKVIRKANPTNVLRKKVPGQGPTKKRGEGTSGLGIGGKIKLG